MVRVFFVFVGEGSSDTALVGHLEELCVVCGADEAIGIAPDLDNLPEKVSRTVEDKLRAAITLEPDANLVFVHRDADAIDPEPRYLEISRAESTVELSATVVPVVPVQETEAWLLMDEEEIRSVADNPNGRVSLDLPPQKYVEEASHPKELLFCALETASGLRGRRLAKFQRTLPRRRRILLQRLGTSGAVCQLPAWKRLKADVETAIRALSAKP